MKSKIKYNIIKFIVGVVIQLKCKAIPKLKPTVKEDVFYTIPDNINLAPVYGGPTNLIRHISQKYSNVYILDIGPHFDNIADTEKSLKFCEEREGKFVWIDHHDWPEDIVQKYRHIIKVEHTESCAELVEQFNNEFLSRNMICFGPDVDSVISAILLLVGKRISKKWRDKLIDIAKKCDSCHFAKDQIADDFHKMVFMARYNESIPELVNNMIWFLTSIPGSPTNLSSEDYMMSLVGSYDALVEPTNKFVLTKEIDGGKDWKLIHTTNIPKADLTRVSSKLYDAGYKYIIFKNNKCFRVGTRDCDDLRKVFGVEKLGVPYKVIVNLAYGIEYIKERLGLI